MQKTVHDLEPGKTYVIMSTDKDHKVYKVTFESNTLMHTDQFMVSRFIMHDDGKNIPVRTTTRISKGVVENGEFVKKKIEFILNKPINLTAYDISTNYKYFRDKKFFIGESVVECAVEYDMWKTAELIEADEKLQKDKAAHAEEMKNICEAHPQLKPYMVNFV